MSEIELTEQILSRINVGKTADVVLNQLQPILDKLSKHALGIIKSEFRAGKFDPTTVQSKIAELVAYENIEIELKAQIHSANKALKNTQG